MTKDVHPYELYFSFINLHLNYRLFISCFFSLPQFLPAKSETNDTKTFAHTGKCIPVIRGGGVYQRAVDLCIEKLAIGDWVHIFPEGKVNMTKENLRFKWGVGRMIYESPVMPIIVPIWHEGMDNVLPNYPPYIIKFGKKITINVGQPINISDLVNSLKMKNTPEPVARKIITDRLQEEMNVSVAFAKRKISPKKKPSKIIDLNFTNVISFYFFFLFLSFLWYFHIQILRQKTEKLHAV